MASRKPALEKTLQFRFKKIVEEKDKGIVAESRRRYFVGWSMQGTTEVKKEGGMMQGKTKSVVSCREA